MWSPRFGDISQLVRKGYQMARVKKETQQKVSAIMQDANMIWQEVGPRLDQIQKRFNEIGEGATTRNKKLERVIKYFSNFVSNNKDAVKSSTDEV